MRGGPVARAAAGRRDSGFESLTAVNPHERLTLETTAEELSCARWT